MIYTINEKLILEFSRDDLEEDKPKNIINDSNDSKAIKSTYKMNVDKLDKSRINSFKDGFNASLKGF